MSCPRPEVVLQFAEGRDVPADTVLHLAACRGCQAQLGALGRFETHLAVESTIDAKQRQALRAVAVRALASAPVRARRRRHLLGGVLALAALVLAALTCWPHARAGLAAAAVHRYVPEAILRAERLERFALQLRLDAPRWLAVWQIDRAVTRLLPDREPLLGYLGAAMPLPAGAHRLPAADALDFEFATAAPPRALVVVPSERELPAADLATIEALLTALPDQLPVELRTRWPEARRLEFPAR